MQRINTSKATITFSCDQDWNEMKSTEKGRFRMVCTKEVIDFTRFSSEEMQRYQANNQQMCGRFLPEQVDLSLVKPISIAPHLRFFAFVSGLFFFVSYIECSKYSNGCAKNGINNELSASF